MAYLYRMTYFLRPNRLRMVNSFSASVFCRAVCLVYFDVNTGFVFNQVLKVVSGGVVSNQ